ncbi:MAG: hypothetical protein ACK4NX_00305 [Candidatus Paceibacteria bacterium]
MYETPKTPIVTLKGQPFKSPGILAQEKEQRSRFFRSLLIGGVTMILVALSGYLLDNVLLTATPRAWLWFALSFLFWISMFSLSSLSLSWKWNMLLCIVSPAMLTITFWRETNPFPLLVLIFLSAGGLYLSGAAMQKRHSDMLHIRTREIVKAGLPLAIFTLSVLFSGTYYFTLQAKFASNQFFIQEDAIKAFLRSSSSILKPFLPEFSENITLSKLLSSFSQGVQEKAFQNFISKNPSIQNLPETELNRIKLQIAQESQKEILKNFSSKLGQTLTGNERVSQVIYNYFANWFSSLSEQSKATFLLGWVIATFLVIWSLGYIAILFSPFIFWVLFQIFRYLNIIKVTKIPTEREIIGL